MVLAFGVITGFSGPILVATDDVIFGVKGGVDLLLFLFLALLVSVLLIFCCFLLEFLQILSQTAVFFKPVLVPIRPRLN